MRTAQGIALQDQFVLLPDGTLLDVSGRGPSKAINRPVIHLGDTARLQGLPAHAYLGVCVVPDNYKPPVLYIVMGVEEGTGDTTRLLGRQSEAYLPYRVGPNILLFLLPLRQRLNGLERRIAAMRREFYA